MVKTGGRTSPYKPTISQDGTKAIKELKEDNSWAILTADKGEAMVVMDIQDYSKRLTSY